MNKFPWAMLIVFLLLLVLSFAVALPFFMHGTPAAIGWRTMSPMMGSWGMMGGLSWLGALWMIGRLIVPLAVIALAVVGVVALVRGRRNGTPAASCPACSRPVQAGWVACPACGQKL